MQSSAKRRISEVTPSAMSLTYSRNNGSKDCALWYTRCDWAPRWLSTVQCDTLKTVWEKRFHPTHSSATYAVRVKFYQEPFMRYRIKCFRKIKNSNVSADAGIQIFSPIVNCKNQLCFARVTCSKTMLPRWENIIGFKKPTDTRMNDMFQEFAADAS